MLKYIEPYYYVVLEASGLIEDYKKTLSFTI